MAIVAGVSLVAAGAIKARGARKAGEKSAEGAEDAAAISAALSRQAIEDAKKLFGAAQENQQRGVQGALDIFKEILPEQFLAFQRGNLGAQQTLLGTLPQVQNAILGLPTQNPFAPQRFATPEFNFQLPEFITSAEALGPPQGQLNAPLDIPSLRIGGGSFAQGGPVPSFGQDITGLVPQQQGLLGGQALIQPQPLLGAV